MFRAFPRLSVVLVSSLLAACASAPKPVSDAGCANCAPAAHAPSVTSSAASPAAAPAARSGGITPLALSRPLLSSSWSELPGWSSDSLDEAWPAFLASCRALARQPVWQTPCDAARSLGGRPSAATVRSFMEARFNPWRVVNPDGTQEGLVTGYYEPLIKGSRTRSKSFQWPVLGVPEDLLTIELGDLFPELKGQRVRGRLVGNKVVPYFSRSDMARQPDKFAGKTILYAEDPIELFFLQVQGSGRVQLPDGGVVRLAYADTNGYAYQSIGRWLVDRGEMKMEQASMDGIKNWARANPARLQELLNANPSYIFFREVASSAGGPVGAIGQPLTEGRSMAVDPRSVPLGAPVFLSTTYPNSQQPLRRLMLAQDTGSAIKGGVRGDFFWGFGAEAGVQAGRMRQKGEMWVLWPRDQIPR
ncbi:MAG: murein transglycosylase A [Proteobacteria bacterium]|nr:murein transglycosylase A [Pseudomonadota bacterium]